MKIDDSFKKTGAVGVSTTPAKASSSKGAEKTEAVNTAATSDSVKISAQAQALGGTSTFDVKKVNEIKAAIASGTFQVNPEKVANGLIDTVKDLLSSRKG
ncbi:flagellar biosynthesis anti-sigma factor FlgM [Actimicrobium sp. CCC2.4]|uniref:flagellar biosynthesis anti-sigma factor FlgM n=1 Tax=Actimicrobium sp. CCC2.4 TaxID=3048606 RepID=UPI002AC8D300|nr:flagellar biosynthesis anti-sigma factor FlgM [Actimicrobium sp. CCC2.4]MEB0135253.1 flagellar biosynthesis anti-sigma factor FlgM [Actimicrobium sp. CCC2.4]WPX31046.1 flagellar biosynthesis anti-sigma factor FlgM [Actimicrobium sp. CCC2.4]